jgi:hypothetical protein
MNTTPKPRDSRNGAATNRSGQRPNFTQTLTPGALSATIKIPVLYRAVTAGSGAQKIKRTALPAVAEESRENWPGVDTSVDAARLGARATVLTALD